MNDVREALPESLINESLHVARNPYGYAPEQIREATLNVCDALESARRALAAEQEHPAVPDRERIPREPTIGMQNVGVVVMFDAAGGDLKVSALRKIVRKGWRAMYDVALQSTAGNGTTAGSPDAAAHE